MLFMLKSKKQPLPIMAGAFFMSRKGSNFEVVSGLFFDADFRSILTLKNRCHFEKIFLEHSFDPLRENFFRQDHGLNFSLVRDF